MRDNKDTFVIPDDVNIVSMRPHRDGDIIQYAKNGHYFKLSYARLAPFLTSKVRNTMLNAIYPHREHVYRVHTDSILSSIPIDTLKLSKNIGEWKIEHSGPCSVINATSVIWE